MPDLVLDERPETQDPLDDDRDDRDDEESNDPTDDEVADVTDDINAGDAATPAAAADDEHPEVLQTVPLPSTDPIAITNLIASLASTLSIKGTLLLVVSKQDEDSILVTVQPGGGNEDAGISHPLQISAPSATIDAEVRDALSTYVPARSYALAVASAHQVSRAIVDAANKKKPAAKATPPKVGPTLHSLTVTTVPTGAAISVTSTSGKGAMQSLKSGKPALLAPGTYSIAVSAAQMKTHIRTVDLAKAEHITIELVPDTLDLFSGDAS